MRPTLTAEYAVLPVAAGLGVASLVTAQPAAAWSAALAVDAATSMSIIYWPAILGLGAGLSVRQFRSGSTALIEVLPRKGIVRWAMGAMLKLGLLAALGQVLLAGAALIRPAMHQSWPTPTALLPLLVAVIGDIGLSGLGWAAGALWHTWLVPPLLAGLCYVMVALQLLGFDYLVAFTGATGTYSAVAALSVRVVLCYLALFALAWLVGAAVLVWRANGGRFFATMSVAFGVGTVCAWVALSSAASDGVMVGQDQGRWPCAAVGAGDSKVCVPPDQRRDLEALAVRLEGFDERLTALDSREDGWVYQPDPWLRGDGMVLISLPFGGANQQGDADFAATVAGSFAPCLSAGSPADVTEEAIGAVSMVAAWLDPASSLDFGLATAPTLEQAREALAAARQCG